MKTRLSAQQIIRHCVLIVIILTCLWACKKESDPDASAVVGAIYTTVDQQPIPPGGQAGLTNYLIKNVRYPAEALRAKIQGKVIVGFVVTSSGRIANVQVQQSVGGGCDEETVRVVKGMPDWRPVS